jgi:hypothetical protein
MAWVLGMIASQYAAQGCMLGIYLYCCKVKCSNNIFNFLNAVFVILLTLYCLLAAKLSNLYHLQNIYSW